MIDSKMTAAAVIIQRTARLRRRPKETAIVLAQTAVIPLQRTLVPFQGRPSAAIMVLIVGIISLMYRQPEPAASDAQGSSTRS